MKKINILFYFRFLFGLALCFGANALAGPPVGYPIPPETDNSLFYLQRSSNSNTIVYDVKRLSNGHFNPKEPVEVYWVRYNSTGNRKALNFIERKFAYGLSFDRVDMDTYTINLMAYSERDITVQMSKDGKVKAFMRINGQVTQLKRIYIDVSGSGFWTTVNFVELTGVDLNEGRVVRERFDPNDDE